MSIPKAFFVTDDGIQVPTVSEGEMRAVDHVAEAEFGLSVLQMMENAGRTLAEFTLQQLPSFGSRIVVFTGSGGNGGGGICCVRNLRNRGTDVDWVSSKALDQLRGPATAQARIVSADGADPIPDHQVPERIRSADVIIDALIGYRLRGEPEGRVRDYIELMNQTNATIISLDMPSGMDATTGETPGVFVQAAVVLTLALPKTGLRAYPGDLYLVDIGIPLGVYQHLEIPTPHVFTQSSVLQLHSLESV